MAIRSREFIGIRLVIILIGYNNVQRRKDETDKVHCLLFLSYHLYGVFSGFTKFGISGFENEEVIVWGDYCDCGR